MPKVIRVKRHPFGKGFLAITLGEIILTRAPLGKYDLNHELIHVAQQRELLYIPFFIWYGLEWLLLYFKYGDWIEAYYHIRFEKEAYANQNNLNYLQTRKHYCYAYATRN